MDKANHNKETFELILHRFRDYPISPHTKILIVGTFNPETEGNPAAFFYGRQKNFFWKLLPGCFKENDLKQSTVHEKETFIKKHNIGFTDFISELKIPAGKSTVYADAYIDAYVHKWMDIKAIIKSLPALQKIVVTRKTFTDVPNIKKQKEELEKYCVKNNIAFECLPTPARFYNKTKQEAWASCFNKLN